jgi:uncharacterized protein with FMN-binding domain
MRRPALATAGTFLGILLLLAGKDLTAPSDLALSAGSSVIAPDTAGTATGTVVNTRYGPVQVQVVAASGRLTKVTALQLPTGGKSGSIADYAAPILGREAVAAQGAGIHAVSGATFTSEGYAESLQAALDQLAASSSSASTSGTGS